MHTGNYNIVMSPTLDRALREDFRHLTTTTDPTAPFASEGFGVYDGWEPLLRRLLAALEAERNKLPHADAEQVRLFQVKEKWGGLRVYVNGATEAMQNLLDQAERESFGVCERCGATGEDVYPSDRGWVSTLCPSCCGK